jgi:hypothetical protein
LNEAGAGQEERQWWHNRAVHDAYGVAAGLVVQPAAAGEQPSLLVQPGLAYDSYGRALAVLEATRVAPPRSAGLEPDAAWTLLLRAPAGGACHCGCGPSGPARVDLVWRRSARVDVADGVALTRGRWAKDGEDLLYHRDVDFQTLLARPFARPRLGRGHTPLGATAWRAWSEVVGPSSTSDRLVVTARGIEVTIDTSAAGFTRVPCYFAWLQGGPWQVSHRLALTVLLPRITRDARDEFTFSIWDPSALQTAGVGHAASDGAAAALARLLALARQRLYVSWLGVETDHAAFHARPQTVEMRRPMTEPR